MSEIIERDSMFRLARIWCENCGIAPLRVDYMKADENGGAATDLICDKCDLIIATLHHVEG